MRALLAATAVALGLTGCGAPADGSDGIIPAHRATPSAQPSGAVPVHLASSRAVGIVPVRLRVPSLHIDVRVVAVGQTPAGDVAVPGAWQDAGWYSSGFRPGQLGHAVIVGHLDTDDAAHPAAAFSDLHMVVSGAEVTVSGSDGSELRYAVSAVHRYPVEAVPLHDVFGPASASTLELITCAGTWRTAGLGYGERLVVTARQVTT
jgi:sortase A